MFNLQVLPPGGVKSEKNCQHLWFFPVSSVIPENEETKIKGKAITVTGRGDL